MCKSHLWIVPAGTLVLFASHTGCAAVETVRLEQPFAPPAQRAMQLTPELAVIAERGDDLACLLSLGLPGARAGPRAYAAYYRFKPQPAEQRLSPADDACGFLVQEVGELRGKSVFDSGTLRYQPRDWLHAVPMLDLDAIASDGTRLSGRVSLTDDNGALKSFERRYAGDVAALCNPSSQPTPQESTDRETPARRARRQASP